MNLPISNHYRLKYDNILIIIYYVIKYALFLPIRADLITINLAQLFFKHVECYFETPRGVIINKNFYIIFNFWREICEIKIIKK